MDVMHGTNTTDESCATASCMPLLFCKRAVSKFTRVLQPDSISHNLNLESEPEILKNIKKHILEINLSSQHHEPVLFTRLKDRHSH